MSREQVEALRAAAAKTRQQANYCDRGADYAEMIAEAAGLQRQADALEAELNAQLLAEVQAELNPDAT